MDIYMKIKLTIGLLYFLQTLTCIQGEYNFTYLGCFKEEKSQRVLSHKPDNFQGSENTIEYCVALCGQDGYRYAGLQNGDRCWCGYSGYDRYGSEGAICDYECSGNNDQICGGLWATSVYEVVKVTTTRSTNATTTTTTSNATSTASIKIPQSDEDDKVEYTFTYVGCFKEEKKARAIENAPDNFQRSKNTIEYCVTLCGQEGYRYAGLQYSQLCWCGNSGYDRDGSEGAICDHECSGNSSQICGGYWTTSVYEVVEQRSDDSNNPGNDGTYIGIGVGAVVVCAIIVLVVVLVVRRRQKTRKNQSRTHRSTTDSSHQLEPRSVAADLQIHA